MTRALGLALLATAVGAAGLVELAAAARAARAEGLRSPSARAANAAAVLARVGRALGARRAPESLGRRLELAGVGPAVGVTDVMAVKCGCAVVAFLLAPLATALPARLRLIMLVGAPLAAFFAPDVLLVRRIRRRAQVMAEELPDVLDLLHVAVAAGLSPLRALGEVGRRRGGVLAAELRSAATRIELGLPRAAALAVLRRRCPAEGIEALVGALERAEIHGAPLGATLAAIAADARARRAHVLRERAARAGPKIQLVVALLLVPAVMLLVAAALAAGLR